MLLAWVGVQTTPRKAMRPWTRVVRDGVIEVKRMGRGK